MLYKGRETPIRIDSGGFIACPAMPGWADPMSRDHGLGPLAMVVRSCLDPGRIIAMHEHRNDEIISWVPDGVMRHDDRLHGKLVTDAGHLMVMNAGRSFWHSEALLADDPPLDMLQIFVRPDTADLEPKIQHGALAPVPPDRWRHIVGPEGSGAPFFVRNTVDIYDIRCREGSQGTFPALRGGGPLNYLSETDGILVAFLPDPQASVSRSGTIGDNPRLPPVLLFRLFSLWSRLRRYWRD